ncbi:LysR substrate-binding domain-containing protein [Vogesella sp. LIG4]|uniref:LysR substrate-binding domain-containing protein n=1 Tax=Vogesella sp. LIG4 TaxID=1192162 RepID=UPI00081F8D4F|nr:LysR substrate-binding domain-containing protein [Vogesella sp. LIG4]SCK08853.1 LysR family transcriptional regulator, nitrogen assimilation regulatory protein [Vogesella sp. LIG4]
MDLKQIEYFIKVAELGSFTRAAIVLDIAQPALSRQIRQLEVELRQTLLLRNGRGVTLTEAGKLLLEHGRGVLHQVERTREELGRVRGALAGKVALGLPPSLSRVLSVPLSRAFRSRLPEASLAIREGLSANMLEALRNGRLDVALLYNPVPSADIDIVPLCDEALYLVELAGDDASGPLSLAELAARPLVIPSQPHAIRMLVESELGARGLRPTVALEIDSVPAILELVADGAGSAVLSRLAVSSSDKADKLRLRQIGEPGLQSRLALAVSSHRPSTLTQQAMQELLREMVPAIVGGPLLPA